MVGGAGAPWGIVPPADETACGTPHGYDKDGNRKEYSLMKFGSPMTQNRYIAVVHNSNRGVVS